MGSSLTLPYSPSQIHAKVILDHGLRGGDDDFSIMARRRVDFETCPRMFLDCIVRDAQTGTVSNSCFYCLCRVQQMG